ncbi:MAG: TolC family protein [Epsilonproteobacteria bacterium]|nr:TolC family protein [Campylobacterota bacterium]
MRILASIACASLLLSASESALTLDEAMGILKSQNLEIKVASYDEEAAHAESKSVKGMHYGKIDLIQDIANSNDAGSVFGFKLSSREATFGDFGFDEFIAGMGTITPGSPNFDGGVSLLATAPDKLNYPEARTYFQTKLKYEVPLFTGFAISSYENIMNAMSKMKSLEKEQVLKEKSYQLRKSYYDMALLNESIKNLSVILENIDTLENMTKQMIDVGYAKKVDILEVQAKKGNVQRLVAQMESNKELLYHFISFLLNQDIQNITALSSDVPMIELSNEAILESNLDIQRATTGLEIRKNMLSASQSAYMPMVGAFGEVSSADDTFLGSFEDHLAYTIGARLSWNLFNGGVDAAKVQKARVEELKTKTQVELAKQGILLQIDKIRTEIKEYDLEIESLNKELALADEIYKSYEGRYKEKLASMSDVIIKQSEQIEKILMLQMAHNKRNERVFALEKLANGEK